MSPRVATGTFVGRAHELEQLTAALEATEGGRGSAVLVSGEAGIGKTRLVAELGAQARDRGAVVLTGRCLDLVGAGLPYLPLVEALRPLRGQLADLPFELRELPRLVPELGREAQGESSQLRLFEETLAVLEHVSAPGGLVLAVEDLHWADASTIDLVAFLAHAVGGSRILCVATFRSDELGPEDPRRRPLDELLRARAAVELRLEPLVADELEQLLLDETREAPSAEVLSAIQTRSEGNPFFAEELLAAALRGDEALPHVVRDVLLRRVARLDAESRSVLRAAAAAGRDVTYGLLSAVTPLDEHDLVEALRLAVESRILTAEQSAGTLRFRHALLAEAVYGTLLPGEREELHTRLANALRDDPSLAASRFVAGELALHWDGAGRSAEALGASIDAAREAEELAGRAEARRHVDRALDLWAKVEDPEAVAGLDLRGLLAWAAELADLTGDASRAAALAGQVVEVAGEEVPPDDAALLDERRATYLLHAGAYEEARAALRRAAEAVPQESPARVRVLATLAYALLPDNLAESMAASEGAMELARKLGGDAHALRAKTVLGTALCYDGRTGEGLARLREARAEADARGPEELTLATIALCDALIVTGRLHEAATTAVEGLEVARRNGLERGHGVALAVNAAAALIGLGDWPRAEAVLAPALRAGTPFWAHYPHMFQAELHTARGRFESAHEHLEQASPGASRPWAAMEYACLTAELALWEGRTDDARRAVEVGLRSASLRDVAPHRTRLSAVGLRAEAERSELAGAQRDARAVAAAHSNSKRLLAVAEGAGPMPEAAAWRAVAEAEHTRVEGRSSPERWRSAIEAWDAAGRPYPAAYCRWRLTEALLAAGAHPADAALPAREGYRVASWLGAVPLQRELELLAQRARLDLVGLQPEERAAEGDPALGLTARELDVLRLVARGYTNREIASELVISAKTASVHVSNILRKLGAANRLEAATIAHRLMPDS